MRIFFILLSIKATTSNYNSDRCANNEICLVPDCIRVSLDSLPVHLSFLRSTNIKSFLDKLKQNQYLFKSCDYLRSFTKDFELISFYFIEIDVLSSLDYSKRNINSESITNYILIYNRLELGNISLTFMKKFLEWYTPIILDDIEDLRLRETSEILTKKLLEFTHVYSSAYYHFRTIYFYFKTLEIRNQ